MKSRCLALAAFCLVPGVVWGQTLLPAPTSPQALATRLVQEKNPAHRTEMLKTQQRQVNCDLAQALNAETDKLLRERQNAQAVEIAPLAEEVARTCPTQRERATALNNLGRAHYQMSRYEPARSCFQQALELRRALPDKLELAQSLNNLASYFEVKAQYNPALAHYQESQRLKQQLIQPGTKNAELLKSIARGHGNMGLCHRYLGDYDLALAQFRQGVKLYADLQELRGLATLSNYTGDTLTEMGQWEPALEQFQQSLDYNQRDPLPDPELQAQILNNIGLVQYLNQKYDLALAACRESLRLREAGKNTERIARTQRRLAMIHLARNELTEALNNAQAAAKLSQQHTETFWKARLVEGEVQLALKNPAAAQQYFTEAIQTIEEMRTQAPRAPDIQQRFFENKTLPYLALTDLLLTEQRPLEALAYAERTKARVILDLIQANPAAAPSQLPAWLASAAATQAEMSALAPASDTLLLEFVIAKEKVHLFALTRTQATTKLQTFPLAISAAQLKERVQQFRTEVAQRKLSFAAQAQALYQELLQPAAALLRQKKKVVIVPDGILWELPFQALLSAENRFLWQDHTISYAPSLTAWQSLRQRQVNRQPAALTLLALGAPVLPANDAATSAALPFAKQQMQQLSQIYGRNTSRVLVGEAATEQVFKAEAAQYGVIHLATHGIYDDRNPMASRVLLTPTKAEDGSVEAQEILNLKLTNQLIVLSACETGRGRLGPGEGVIGLTWAFLIAGCPTLVASQWEVRDDSTSTLMSGFHRALKTGAQPSAEALRQAALSLLQSPKYKHPYYWAGFVLIGDGQ